MNSSLTPIFFNPAKYVLPVGSEDDDRLDALSSIFNPTSLQFIEKLSTVANTHFLDVGCGNGNLMIEYARNNPTAFCLGVDISKEQVEIAQQKASKAGLANCAWDVCDVYHLEALASRHPALFDIVHSRFVLSHLSSPIKAIDSMLAMLKSGGMLFLEESSRELRPIVNNGSSKPLDAWCKMVEWHAVLQNSHSDTAEIAFDYLHEKLNSVVQVIIDIEVMGTHKKSMYRLGAEHAVKKLDDMGNPALVKTFGYEDSQTWLQELIAFEQDDLQTLTNKNFTLISATK